jgi:hypothetical protein
VYQVEATRENKNFAWVPVQGLMQIKVSQSTETEGTFIFFYSNYKEPQFVMNTCSGGLKGNVELTTSGGTSGSDTGVYDPSTPYDNGSGTTTIIDLTDPSDPNKTISPIFQYFFNLKINFRSLDPACRNEADRTIALYRFANGQVIMVNEYRELKMNPVLVELN